MHAGESILLQLPQEIVLRIARLLSPSSELFGICKPLRTVCLANATVATFTRGYEGAHDDVHVATLARCPRLVRMDVLPHMKAAWAASANSWPLASLTRLTALTVWSCWEAKFIPTSLRELTITAVVPEDRDWYDNYHTGGGASTEWRAFMNLLRDVRDRTCTIYVLEMECAAEDLRLLNEAWMAARVRVGALELQCSCDSPPPVLQLPIFSDLTRLDLIELDAASVHAGPSLRELCLSGSHYLEDPSSLTVHAPHAALTLLEMSEFPVVPELQLAAPGTPQLRKLCCHDFGVDAVALALQQPALQDLSMRCFGPDELRMLHACTTLTRLQLSCNGFLPAAGAHQPLTALCKLMLASVNELEDFERIADAFPAQVTSLCVHQCGRLSSLCGLSQATALRALDLVGCDRLRSLDVGGAALCLPHLSALCISRCSALLSLGDCFDAPQLQLLKLVNFQRLSSLCGLERFRQLESGVVFENLPRLLDLRGLDAAGKSSLRSLRLEYLKTLTSLSGLGGATALTALSVGNCPALSTLQSLTGMDSLASLELNGPSVTSLCGLPARLRSLSLLHPALLRSLDGLCSADLSGLTKLHINLSPGPSGGASQASVANLRCLENATQLAELFLSGFMDLTSLEGLEGAVGLQALELNDFWGLQSLRSLSAAQLTSLKLKNVGSSGEQHLDLARLQVLKLEGCSHICSLAALGVPALPTLATMELCDMPFKDLDGIASATRLQYVRLCMCFKLTSLCGLEWMDIAGDQHRYEIECDARAMPKIDASLADLFTLL